MKSNESVYSNSLVMPKIKSKNEPYQWFKVCVHFNSPEDCNNAALPVAIKLRDSYPAVYFARYCNAQASRADFYVRCSVGQTHTAIIRGIIKRAIAHGGARSISYQIDKPVKHEGSDAHAAGFDCVLLLARAFFLNDEDERTKTDPSLGAALSDVVHWMHNMLGFDYVDEARRSLYAVERILKIFESCIKAPTKEAAKN